jgi:hypothetical protein
MALAAPFTRHSAVTPATIWAEIGRGARKNFAVSPAPTTALPLILKGLPIVTRAESVKVLLSGVLPEK